MLRAGRRPLGGGCSCELACSPAYVMIRMPSVTPLKDTHVQPMNGDLGGVFKYFLFSPLFGEDFHFDSYFSEGLVQPPTSDCVTDSTLVNHHVRVVYKSQGNSQPRPPP